MKRSARIISGALSLLACLTGLPCSYSATSQIRISSLSRAGKITWTGVSSEDPICLQWASSIIGPWQSTANGQSLALNSTANSTVVPIPTDPTFYRIRRANSSAIVDALTERTTVKLSPLAVRFDPPPGDGRGSGGGVVVFGDSAFDALGSTWEFDYAGNDHAAGVQVIHPYQSGQFVVRITLDTLVVSTPVRWLEIGYGIGGSIDGVTQTANYTNYFPLKTATTYHMKTAISATGALSVFINQVLVATAVMPAVHAIDFRVSEFENFPSRSSWDLRPFRGTGFPLQWQKSYTGLILEPTDRGSGLFTGVFNLRYVPGL